MSRKIVEIAINTGCSRMEDLEGIRKTAKQAWSFRYSLNSWSFYQLRQFVAGPSCKE
ncbi:hypothetical protein [Methanocella conradii]|uniref:hypothetical protein n=1 Tax=Methanocella conradii TaxID=1175444 RepID=UPI001C2D8F6B|nr:hypothetical protein [Methanocella conradii]